MQSLTLPRRVGVTGLGPKNLGSALNIAIPVAVAALAASAAYAGADTTFTPALTKFTDFLEGSGGKIITVLSLLRRHRPFRLLPTDRKQAAMTRGDVRLSPVLCPLGAIRRAA